MEFPVTVESQEDFDGLVKGRLDREKTKQTELQVQVDALTAEKQALETKSVEFETRATAAETRIMEHETEQARTQLTGTIAKEFGITADVLRGADEAELRAHAEALKPLITGSTGPIPDLSKTPTNNPKTSPEHELVRGIFKTD